MLAMNKINLISAQSICTSQITQLAINVDFYRFLAMFSWILIMDLQLWLILHSDRCCNKVMS